ncbi:serine/threonine-protein kinase [Allostreptomyces psammosilenae]|uniref:non-specific serine/threonine protein kinase n=1 Tax=Allostreptomyces psammosilenae TaxID=1892865 RepID=A0A853A4G5_9ACTN|nr:serine/threonine-protein kinase [Allostreptomyces psammosilenae]NYI05392.1 serine/threonine protein kinase [Allostreptomyces psammosilenae]
MGEVFAGRYELVDPIGRGGVGEVWRAWDHRLRRYVAAKILQQRDAHALMRFVREQALRIDHPHVLAPTSWAADDDQVLFTMELVTGGSVAGLLRAGGPLPPGTAVLLTDQLLAGLAAVHDEGVVHRDIKPANLLLRATGTGRPHLYLSDFGIAVRQGEPRLTAASFVVGTLGYFAPEQLDGADPEPRQDLYAVGVVLLEMLTAQRMDQNMLLAEFAGHSRPPARGGIPDPLWQVVCTLLRPRPEERFGSALGVRRELAAVRALLGEGAGGGGYGRYGGYGEGHGGPDGLGGEDHWLDVPDRIGPLPPGYGPAGPEHGGTRPAPPHAAPPHAAPPPHAVPPSHPVSPAPTAPAAHPGPPTAPAGPGPLGGPGATPTPAAGGFGGPSTPAPGPLPTPTGPTAVAPMTAPAGGSGLLIALGLLSVVLIAFGLWAVATG